MRRSDSQLRSRSSRRHRAGFFRILGGLRSLASRILGVVTAGLAASGLLVAATWTNFARGTLAGNVNPAGAIYQTGALTGRIPTGAPPGAFAPGPTGSGPLAPTSVDASFAPTTGEGSAAAPPVADPSIPSTLPPAGTVAPADPADPLPGA